VVPDWIYRVLVAAAGLLFFAFLWTGWRAEEHHRDIVGPKHSISDTLAMFAMAFVVIAVLMAVVVLIDNIVDSQAMNEVELFI
jgi:uncharacterized membrane protein